MSSSPKIGLICGSLRKGSINQKLCKALIYKVNKANAKASLIDLANYDMPIFHGDLEASAIVKKLVNRIKSFDGIIIVSPEYNGCMPPLLKNAIDWTTTVETGHITKPVYGIASCTPGPLSGVMVMRQLQFILLRLGADLVPTQTGCGNADSAFGPKGALIAQPAAKLADKMIGQMLERIAARG